MFGVDVQDALVALGRLLVLLAVLVEEAQIQQRSDVGGKVAGGPLVELHREVVIAAAIVFQGEYCTSSSGLTL